MSMKEETMEEVEKVRQKILIRRGEIMLMDTIAQVMSVITFFEKHGLKDSVEHPALYQKYLKWLDELNKISVRD